MLTQQTRLRIGDDVLDQEVQGESVLLHLGSESYFSLNATGTLVWRCLRAGGTLGEAVAAVVASHQVDEATAQRDVEALVGALVAAGLARLTLPDVDAPP
jgi:hypothetical protein